MKTITKTITYLQMSALLLTAALAGPAAADEEVPFKGSIHAVETSVLQPPVRFVDSSGSGNATHLGHFTVSYEFVIELATRAGIGSAHFIAANGDSLFTEALGQGNFTDDPDVRFVVETHTITGGTGRFAGATGSFIVERLISLSTGVTSGSFDGTIVIHDGNFKGSIQAVETYDTQFPALFVDSSGSGNGTHLGRFTVISTFEVNLLTIAGSGSAHLIAANGGSLFTELTGQAYLTEDPEVFFIVETYTITGGTGRFAGATGSFTVERLLNTVTGVTSGSFEGTIVTH
jgi:hypothetical protein